MSGWLPSMRFPLSGLHHSIMQNCLICQLSVTNLWGLEACCLRRILVGNIASHDLSLIKVLYTFVKTTPRLKGLLLFSDVCIIAFSVAKISVTGQILCVVQSKLSVTPENPWQLSVSLHVGLWLVFCSQLYCSFKAESCGVPHVFFLQCVSEVTTQRVLRIITELHN